jgi:hypothetical protein
MQWQRAMVIIGGDDMQRGDEEARSEATSNKQCRRKKAKDQREILPYKNMICL